jgi:molybdopterin converting factor small subunit
MIVTVRLFARAKDLARLDVAHLELVEGATVAELRGTMNLAFPGLTTLLKRSLVAVNGDLATDATVLKSDQEVAILPPVSGGAC